MTMKISPGWVAITALGMLVSVGIQAQVPVAGAANADIVKMLQAGLPESTVVNKIREGAGHWDTSVDGLIALKKAGATEAELGALTATPPPMPAGIAAPPRPADIPVFGGMLGYTAIGVPYIQFPAGVLLPTLTGEPSNRIFLMRDGGRPLVVIPASFASMPFDIGLYGLGSKYTWEGSHEGNLLWSTTDVRFEDLCLVPNMGGFVKDKGQKQKVWVDPAPLLDDFFLHKKQIADIHAPIGFRERKSLPYMGTLKNDKLTGDVFIPGLQGYTWQGRANDAPAPSEYRSPELQAFINKLIEHPEETIAEFAKTAKLPPDASFWTSALDYRFNTKEAARQYASENAQFVAELKAKQPPSGNGFGSFLNVMQGVQNMASAQSAANVAAANHDMAGQLQAVMNAGTAEVQTLNAVSSPNAATIQPLAPADPNAIQKATNQQLANIQAAQARAQAAQVQKPQQTAHVQTAFRYNVASPAPGAPVANSGTASPPTCVDLGPGNCMTIAQYQQMLTQQKQQATQMQVCPASGFVPGPGHYASCDAYLGERNSCMPGQSVPIAVPPPPPAGCGPVNAGSGGGVSSAAGSNEPAELACLQMSRDAHDMPVFHNVCSFTLRYYWTPVNPRPGEYKEQNGYLDPGATDVGVEGNGEPVLYYACKKGDLVVGPDGSVITQAVSGYHCVKP